MLLARKMKLRVCWVIRAWPATAEPTNAMRNAAFVSLGQILHSKVFSILPVRRTGMPTFWAVLAKTYLGM